MTKKITLPIAGAALLAAISGFYMLGTPEAIEPPAEIVELIETIEPGQVEVEMTEEQYQVLRKSLKEKLDKNEISMFDYLYVDTPEIQLLRAIVSEEKRRVEVNGSLTSKDFLSEIIGEAVK